MKEKKSKNFLFNFIAPVYGLFYNSQKRTYRSIIDNMNDKFDITQFNSIIDVGCGTGALSSVLNENGLKVTGIDPAIKMLKKGKKKIENKEINFIECTDCSKIPFEDKSFDLSIASYVAHGLHKEERHKLYSEMNRLTKKYVIFHDYNNERRIPIDIIEWLEGGDYFNFIKVVKTELDDHFKSVQIINIKKHAAWYICESK